MVNNPERKISLYTQIAVILNILLFFSFGVRYLIVRNTGSLIGWLLIIAGFTNIIMLLFKFSKKNRFFMVLNFIYAIISFIVFFDFRSHSFFGYLWIAITIYYLVAAIIIMVSINKGKENIPE